ncbi:NAD-dependent deacylase [Sediminibacterium sp. KACHI17]|uniref:NAD-dependent protein deacylase n=1 Tax=Sediminibacterium sp. KACHI17 TaxID=1751071 RepID=A0AAT9GGS4_9BACT
MGKKQKLVVLTGAGISAESGIKTFRDSDGLWEGHDVYEVASPRGWKKDPALVLEFYNQRRRDIANALPNDAHKGLAELEQYFDVQIITQNIDDLHERGGSTHVLHLHGEIFKMRSELDESLIYPIRNDIKPGDTAEDGHQLRPFIVWFEEPVPKIAEAIDIARTADIFVVIGTSLVVYPAAGLLDYVHRSIPKYIIDKKIPAVDTNFITPIETTASEGVKTLQRLLLENKK